MNEVDMARALTRIAHEILEHNQGSGNLLILGIPTGGAHLAKRIAQLISKIEGVTLEAGTLDVTLHRDDLRMRAPRALMPTYIPSNNSASIKNSGVEGRDVVLIDDVLFSGRTIRAALDALGELGRPKTVQLAVLIDRGHRELPIRADYVGKNIPTNHSQSVKVLLSEVDGRDEVILG
jgi:pyrimidine operon attenuation protein/uracil phosphoribosyltransferase